MNQKKIQLPVLITIFGAKGDLTRRKLIPALYNLYTGNHLPAKFAIYCVDFLATDETAFKNDLLAGVNEFSRNGMAETAKWNEFAANLFYMQGDFQKDGDISKPEEKGAMNLIKRTGNKVQGYFILRRHRGLLKSLPKDCTNINFVIGQSCTAW